MKSVCSNVRRPSVRFASVLVFTVLFVGLAAAQVPPPRNPPRPVPAPTTPLNITDHGPRNEGKVGQKFFVAGRDLDPAALRLVVTLDGRTAVVQGFTGSSSRAEVTIPTSVLTSPLRGKVVITQGSASATLSESYAFYELPFVVSCNPSRIQVELVKINVDTGVWDLLGKTIECRGVGLSEVSGGGISIDRNSLATARTGAPSGNGVFHLESLITNPKGTVSITGRPTFHPTASSGASRVEVDPSLTFSIGSSLPPNTPAPPAPAPPLPAPRIDSVVPEVKWGGQPVSFLILRPSSQNKIEVRGQNLDQPGSTAKLGSEVVGPVPPPGSNEVRTFSVPANATGGAFCMTPVGKPASCSTAQIKVLGQPKLLTMSGVTLTGSNLVTDAPVRTELTLTGFDLLTNEVPGLVYRFESTSDEGRLSPCNLEFRLISHERTRIRFSFGTPGQGRPAGCSEQQEQTAIEQGSHSLRLTGTFGGETKALQILNLHGRFL